MMISQDSPATLSQQHQQGIPDQTAGQGVNGEAARLHTSHSGRNGYETADDGDTAAEEYRLFSLLFKPGKRISHLLFLKAELLRQLSGNEPLHTRGAKQAAQAVQQPGSCKEAAVDETITPMTVSLVQVVRNRRR